MRLDPEGLLIDTPDGFVSALLAARGRPNLNGNGFTEGTPDQYTSAGKSFIGYTGRYDVDEAKSVMTHRPTVARFPPGAPAIRGSLLKQVFEMNDSSTAPGRPVDDI